MSETNSKQPLMDAVFLDKVRRARETSLEERFLDGPRLFDLHCEIIKGSIRSLFPKFSEEQVEQEYDRRLHIARVIDSAGIYRDVGPIDE